MRKFIYLGLMLGSLSFAQEFKQIKVLGGNESKVLKNVSVSFQTNSLSYTNENGEIITENIDKYQKIQYKKGSQWLSGLVGGMAGGFIGNAISREKDEEIWYGAGPALLIGGGLGAVIGSFFPRYKTLKMKDTSISLGFNSIKVNF